MKIRIIGTGLTKFGELWDQSLLDLSLNAGQQAILESGLDKNQIEAVFVGNMLSSKTEGQDQLGALVASKLGLKGASFRIEAACSSGGLAVHLAIQSLLAGTYKNVLVVGAEKMTDASTSEIATSLMGAGSEDERRAGLTFPGLYALLAKAHMQKFGTTRNHLAKVSVKNHYHASLNKLAQFPFEVTEEKVLESPIISSPFTLFDASPITDGAGAVILSSDEEKSLNGSSSKKGIIISGSAVSSDSVDLAGRDSLLELAATKEASQRALKMAGAQISDIKIAEVHDCFTIAEILAYEDLGFCKKGEGGKLVEEGHTKLGGKLPVNTSGGLKACGHPVGATGLKQIIEVTHQLQQRAGQRQVKGANLGLTHNVGGSGATVVVHILQS